MWLSAALKPKLSISRTLHANARVSEALQQTAHDCVWQTANAMNFNAARGSATEAKHLFTQRGWAAAHQTSTEISAESRAGAAAGSLTALI